MNVFDVKIQGGTVKSHMAKNRQLLMTEADETRLTEFYCKTIESRILFSG